MLRSGYSLPVERWGKRAVVFSAALAGDGLVLGGSGNLNVDTEALAGHRIRNITGVRQYGANFIVGPWRVSKSTSSNGRDPEFYSSGCLYFSPAAGNFGKFG